MKLYGFNIVMLIAVVEVGSSFFWKETLSDNVAKTAEKACTIARSVKAKLNIIYYCNMPTEEQDFMIQLHKCMSEFPIYKLSVDDHSIEPIRHHSSFNIFMIPKSHEYSYACVTQIIAMIRQDQRQKHTHKYLFYWNGVNTTQIQALLRHIWLKNIIHAVVMRAKNQLYTHEPFTATGFHVKKLAPEHDLFDDKLRNWYGTSLNISMFLDGWRALPLRNTTYEGYTAVDGELSRTILQKLNASGNYIAPVDNKQFGQILNNTVSGVLLDIISERTNIAFNARFNLPMTRLYVEELYAHRRRTLYLIVPAAQRIPQYLGFINIFGPKLWSLMLGSFGIVYVIYIIVQYFLGSIVTKLQPTHWLYIFEQFLRAQYGVPVEHFPEISSLRQLLITWIFFSFVLTNIYIARLESSFVQTVYGNEIDEIEQIAALNLPIFAISTFFYSIRDSLPPYYFQIINATAKYLPMRLSAQPFFLPLAERYNRIAFILREDAAKDFILNTYDAERNRPRFHMVTEYLQTLPLTYIVPLGSPYMDKFEMLISAIIEAGIMDHWQDLDVRRRIQTAQYGDDFEVDEDGTLELTTNIDERVVLTLDMMQGVFYMWLLSLLFSGVIFIMEIGFNAYQQQVHNKLQIRFN